MISVVIPLYNKEASIAQSLKSVLSQEYDDFEVVIVDDGSTDGSVGVVEAMNDPRIRLIKQENGGPSKARNTGVKNAKGEWILFLDADDEMLPGALEYFAKNINKHNDTSFIFAPFYTSRCGNKTLACKYQEGMVKNPYKEHFFGENIRRFEDLEWLYRIYKHTRIYKVSKPVLTTNIDFSAASRACKDIKEDFLGHLDFKGKSFWEKMALYALYLGERNYYPEQCRKLYPGLHRRYDWLLLYKLIHFLR